MAGPLPSPGYKGVACASSSSPLPRPFRQRKPPRRRRRRPSFSSSSRSTSSRPNLFDEYRPQFTGGLARLATGTVFHNGYQSHANDRDLPRPFDHPHRRSSGAHRDHRQQLDRPVDRRAPTRRSIAPRTRRVPGSSSTDYKVSPEASAGADAGRADEGALARPAATSRCRARTARR